MQLGKGELLDLLLFVWFVFFYDKPTSLRQGYDLFGPEIKQEPLECFVFGTAESVPALSGRK